MTVDTDDRDVVLNWKRRRVWWWCPDRLLQLVEKESGFLERVAVRVAEEKGVVFCGREGREGTRRVWRRREARRETSTTSREEEKEVAWCRREKKRRKLLDERRREGSADERRR